MFSSVKELVIENWSIDLEIKKGMANRGRNKNLGVPLGTSYPPSGHQNRSHSLVCLLDDAGKVTPRWWGTDPKLKHQNTRMTCFLPAVFGPPWMCQCAMPGPSVRGWCHDMGSNDRMPFLLLLSPLFRHQPGSWSLDRTHITVHYTITHCIHIQSGSQRSQTRNISTIVSFWYCYLWIGLPVACVNSYF